jgi:hypothetical protein
MNNTVADFYRCPEELVALSSPEEVHPRPGYFHFGPETICYGQSALHTPDELNGAGLPDLARRSALEGCTLRLPFNSSRAIDNLRLERYPTSSRGASALLSNDAIRRVYYYFRPMLPESLRKNLQRLYLRDWDNLVFPQWPVDTSVEHIFERGLFLSMKVREVDKVPFIWFWPHGAPCSAIVTHDVETTAGLNGVHNLMDVDDAFDVKSSFQLVPEERYTVTRDLLGAIRQRQCEVNIHGLNHDGNLFRDRKTFLRQARCINRYVRDYGTEGFRSACMYRNVDWYQDLDISYDMSVPNVAHLEPQRGGCCTVFPYFIGRILELPLTTVQDYSLFHILGEYSIKLWKRQIELISQKHGLISFIVHPDYLLREKALSVYTALLAYLSQLRSDKKMWIARPGDVNRWWRERSAMKLVQEHGRWRVEGPGCERARIAFAHIKNDRIVYTVESCPEADVASHVPGLGH